MRRVRRERGATLEELERAYRQQFAAFRRVAAAIVGNRDAALDVVQDAFGAAIRHRASFDHRGSLDGWLWRVVVNTARDHSARATRAVHAEHLVAATSSNGHSDDGRIAAAIALLPERQRLALFLRYYADLDYGGIAAALGISTGTVGATLNAAHTSLRRTLQEARR